MKKILIIISLSVLSVYSAAFEYSAFFDGWIDNRECRTTHLPSETYLNARIDLEGGFLFKEFHRIKFGVGYYKDFGSPKEWKNFSPLLYYHFNRKNEEFLIGVFHRNNMRSYPISLIGDVYKAYNPHIEGIVFEKRGKIFKQNIWLDWTSMKSDNYPEDREEFYTGFSGEFDFAAFYLYYYLLYYHVSHSSAHPKGEHVEDYGGLSVFAGKEFKEVAFIDSMNIHLEGLVSYDRERFVSSGWHTPFGISLGAHLLLNPKIALYGKYHRGIWNDDGSWLHEKQIADRIYRAEDFGLFEFSFLPFNNEAVRSEVKISFYFVDGKVDSRQSFRFTGKFAGLRKLKE